MTKQIPVFLLLCVSLPGGVGVSPALAAETPRIWEQNGYESLDKGTLRKVSLRSDGKLTLAPRFRKVADPALTYIWALAEDSRGNIYMGGGTPAKVVRVNASAAERSGQNKTASGELKPETVFEGKDLEVHALAVDRDDNLYAATSPDPKVYKITRDGKSSVFYEPKAKYVWALAFDARGNLLVATGDKGELFTVDRGGQGKLLFSTDEMHVRSLALDKTGNVIIGTDPGGLVLRVSPEGQGFVLYQTAKKEVTAIELGPDGSIYAAAVGDKQSRPHAIGVHPASAAAPPALTISVQGAAAAPPPMAMPPLPSIPQVTGGSEVYRIDPDGAPRRIWSSKDEVVYALALRGSEKILLGTGNKGKIFQLEGESLYTSLLKAQATQVTAFLRARKSALYAATSNIGTLHEVGGEYEAEGSFESDVFDARHFSRWGRVFWNAESPAGTAIALYTRSGNADNPDRNWAPWASVPSTNGNGRAGQPSSSPGARFIQWKAVLTTSSGGSTPWVDTVEVAYFPKNIKPVIEDVELTQPGYRFQAGAPGAVVQPAQQTISLPPIGQSRAQSSGPVVRFEAPAQLQAQKGAQGVRWAARDENDDTLHYSVFIRGKDERTWKVLKEKITDKHHWWDATAFPDGIYYVKVVATDAPSNAEQDALKDERESGPFEIDNTPPQITALKAAMEGGKLRVSFHAADARTPVKKAEYSLNGSDWRLVLPADQLADGLEEDYSFVVPDSGPGEQTIAVRVYDRIENLAVEKTVLGR